MDKNLLYSIGRIVASNHSLLIENDEYDPETYGKEERTLIEGLKQEGEVEYAKNLEEWFRIYEDDSVCDKHFNKICKKLGFDQVYF